MNGYAWECFTCVPLSYSACVYVCVWASYEVRGPSMQLISFISLISYAVLGSCDPVAMVQSASCGPLLVCSLSGQLVFCSIAFAMTGDGPALMSKENEALRYLEFLSTYNNFSDCHSAGHLHSHASSHTSCILKHG
jgi:hypothetical protein